MITQNKRFFAIVFIVAFLLLIPFLAMQFTAEVNWSLGDFVMAGGLLLGMGFMCELVMRKVKKVQYKIAFCVALLAVCLLVWVELAVGIFGSAYAGQ